MSGFVYRSRKFAKKEGFHDMFSISRNMLFVKDEVGRDLLAVRTLKEVPMDQILFDQGAMEVLKQAAQESLEQQSSLSLSSSSDGGGSHHATRTGPFSFVNLGDRMPHARRNVARLLRSHCAAELSAMFEVFQALAAMRVGPIVCRKFCWVVTYEEENYDDKQSFATKEGQGLSFLVVAGA